MRRVLGGLLLVSAALAQQGREAQQEAHQNWRQADPNLERDAVTAGATLGARADKAAAEAAQYFTAHKAYMESLEKDATQKASAVEAVTLAPDAAPNLEAYLNRQTAILGTSIETIARDADPGIQQLRQAQERERAAIAALSAGLKEIQKTREAVTQSANRAERARVQTAELYQKLAASFQQSSDLTEQSGQAWASYYRALSDAARSSAVPVSSSSVAPSAATVRALPDPAGAVNPPAVPAARGITPVPISRYVGAWTYPTVGAHYHGLQPESADLEVREENGRASGTLSARFRLPAGDANPGVRFNFEGAFQGSREQMFAVTTSDGAKGTLELIPGPAFNLLEVNFSIEEKPGMVRQANFLLVKK